MLKALERTGEHSRGRDAVDQISSKRKSLKKYEGRERPYLYFMELVLDPAFEAQIPWEVSKGKPSGDVCEGIGGLAAQKLTGVHSGSSESYTVGGIRFPLSPHRCKTLRLQKWTAADEPATTTSLRLQDEVIDIIQKKMTIFR